MTSSYGDYLVLCFGVLCFGLPVSIPLGDAVSIDRYTALLPPLGIRVLAEAVFPLVPLILFPPLLVPLFIISFRLCPVYFPFGYP